MPAAIRKGLGGGGSQPQRKSVLAAGKVTKQVPAKTVVSNPLQGKEGAERRAAARKLYAQYGRVKKNPAQDKENTTAGAKSLAQKQKEEGLQAAACFKADPRALQSILTDKGIAAPKQPLRVSQRQSLILPDVRQPLAPMSARRQTEIPNASANGRLSQIKYSVPTPSKTFGWRPSDANKRGSFLLPETSKSIKSVRIVSVLNKKEEVTECRKLQFEPSSPATTLQSLRLNDENSTKEVVPLPVPIVRAAESEPGPSVVQSEPVVGDSSLRRSRRRTADFQAQMVNMSPESLEKTRLELQSHMKAINNVLQRQQPAEDAKKTRNDDRLSVIPESEESCSPLSTLKQRASVLGCFKKTPPLTKPRRRSAFKPCDGAVSISLPSVGSSDEDEENDETLLGVPGLDSTIKSDTLVEVTELKTPKPQRPAHVDDGAEAQENVTPMFDDAEVQVVTPPMKTPIYYRSFKKRAMEPTEDSVTGTPKMRTRAAARATEESLLSVTEQSTSCVNSTAIDQVSRAPRLTKLDVSPIPMVRTPRHTRSQTRKFTEEFNRTPETERHSWLRNTICDEEVRRLVLQAAGGNNSTRPKNPIAGTLQTGNQFCFPPIKHE